MNISYKHLYISIVFSGGGDGCGEPCGTCDQRHVCGDDDECGGPFYWM